MSTISTSFFYEWINLREVIIPLNHCSIDDQAELLLPLLHRILLLLLLLLHRWSEGIASSCLEKRFNWFNNDFDRFAFSPHSTLHILQLLWILFSTEYHWLLDKPAASESRSSCCKRRWTLQESTHRRCPCQSPAHEGMAGKFRVFSKKRISFLGCLIIKSTTNNSLYSIFHQNRL